MIANRESAGYVFGKGTARGFEKMRRRGIVLPPFQIEQAAAKLVRGEFDAMLAQLSKVTIMVSGRHGVRVADNSPEEAEQVVREIIERMEALEETMADDDRERIMISLANQLAECKRAFFKDFFDDASERMKVRVAYALDKDEVFRDRINGIQRAYLERAIDKISVGKSKLRKVFIGMFQQWVEGDRDDLSGLTDIMSEIKKESGTFSKFFARDQFSRFNKSLTLASYETAGIAGVRWIIVGDERVRKSHRKLHGNIYRVDDLPKEVDDYMCRCGLLPVFAEEGKKIKFTRGDGISYSRAA